MWSPLTLIVTTRKLRTKEVWIKKGFAGSMCMLGYLGIALSICMLVFNTFEVVGMEDSVSVFMFFTPFVLANLVLTSFVQPGFLPNPDFSLVKNSFKRKTL